MAQITLLDGSIGQELVKRSGDRATPLWSTRVMIDHPDLVGDVHRAYFDVGHLTEGTGQRAGRAGRLVLVIAVLKLVAHLASTIMLARTARTTARRRAEVENGPPRLIVTT